MTRSADQIRELSLGYDRLWLFLDYDGTLADFAPTFETIKARQGVALVVTALQRKTLADAQLASPQAARDWLNTLARQLSAKASA